MSWRARGLRPWVWQRLSALYLAGAVVYLLVTIPFLPSDYGRWQAWVAEPWRMVLFSGLVPAVLIHAWVGGRDVILDYLGPAWLRMALLTVLSFALAALGLYALHSLLQVGT